MKRSRDDARNRAVLPLIAAGFACSITAGFAAQTADDPARLRLGQIDAMDVSPGGQRVATAEHSGRVVIWTPDDGSVEFTFAPDESSSGAPACLRFVDAGNAVALIYNTGAVRAWRLDTGRLSQRRSLRDESYVSGCDARFVDGDLKILVNTIGGHSVYRLNGRAERIALFEGNAFGQDLALFSPGGGEILIVSDDVRDSLYDAATTERLRAFEFPRQVQAAAFSRDAKHIATGTYLGRIDVWDAQTGQRVHALIRRETRPRSAGDSGNRVWDIVFSADGSRVAAAHGTAVSTWNMRTGQKLDSWSPDTLVRTVAFAADGDRLIAGTGDSPTILVPGNEKRRLVLRRRGDGSAAQRAAAPDAADALLAAIKIGNAQDVSALLAQGADADLVDPLGATPLWIAAGTGHVQIVRLLLDAGANANGRSIQDSTALSMAAQKGHVAIATMLLEAGARVNARDTFGGTALLWAAFYGQKDTVALLLEHGADPDLRRESGETALAMARFRGHDEIVAMLEEIGAAE